MTAEINEDRVLLSELYKHLDAETLADQKLETAVYERLEEVYGDLEAFKQMMCGDYEGFFIIAAELLRALNASKKARFDHKSGIVVLDAIDNARDEFDAYIRHIVEKEL